jgi:hypothetical protein
VAGRLANVQLFWKHLDGNLRLCCKSSRTRSMFSAVCVVDGRAYLASSSWYPVLQEKAYAIHTHMHMITLHHRTLAVLSFKFQWHFSSVSHKTWCYTFCLSTDAANCLRKRLTYRNRQPLQRVEVQVWTCRNLLGGWWIIVRLPRKQNWLDISDFSAIHSVSDLVGHRCSLVRKFVLQTFIDCRFVCCGFTTLSETWITLVAERAVRLFLTPRWWKRQGNFGDCALNFRM